MTFFECKHFLLFIYKDDYTPPWKLPKPIGSRIVFQAPFFRCKLAVSFRKGKYSNRFCCFRTHELDPQIKIPSQFSSWWFQPIWKICMSNKIISSSRGEHKTYLKPPPSFSTNNFRHIYIYIYSSSWQEMGCMYIPFKQSFSNTQQQSQKITRSSA